MQPSRGTPRILEDEITNADLGRVTWSPMKSIWYLSHLYIALIGGWLTFSWQAFAVFIVFTGISLCLGHSLGMHRRLIHNSYQCHRWTEYLFVHLGVLVGMAGPFGMIHQHELRDWAQRKTNCHPYLRHGNALLKDGWWQLNCELTLQHPPHLQLEKRLVNDPVYQWMERTWMWQQLPWALLLFYFGGVAWVIWGISARIAVSVTGHWLIGYFAHNHGQRDWHVDGAAVQGYNISLFGFLSMGEAWHNNHHAFPGSAVLGIYQGQSDPGWWVLNAMHNLGLVWSLKLPSDLPYRPELLPIEHHSRSMKVPKQCPLLSCFS
ncbi:MAG: acyl-CoA desaturase [Thiolinea sp.]